MLKGGWICAAVMVALIAVAPSVVIGQDEGGTPSVIKEASSLPSLTAGQGRTDTLWVADSLSDHAMRELWEQRLADDRVHHGETLNSMSSQLSTVAIIVGIVNIALIFGVIQIFNRLHKLQVQKAIDSLKTQVDSGLDTVMKISEVLVSASHHSMEATIAMSHYVSSRVGEQPRVDLVSRAAESAILCLSTVMQVRKGRTQPPWLYLIRSALDTLSNCARIVPKSSLTESVAAVLPDALEQIRQDSELAVSSEISTSVEEVSKWLSEGSQLN
ncbi:MAG: hypothetical protein KKG33_03655 [candidate division Zixibacteria bacterium]|nr:hypothetical protein [candidate division Zixibacteria bacterium]MBU1469064.1 hypothetical protein [candidate division Zixibacteria bacterium]MBU2624640.1 hypothetical protein [candidate division Zixibacteria bacterium]